MSSCYSDYLNIDYKYPETDQGVMDRHPDDWKKTYPHATFVNLLKRAEKMLARSDPMGMHSIWIHGSYGTGKSQVTWALRRLLVCSDEDFNAYFDEYAPLRAEGDLRTKLSGHRHARKIVVADRNGSGEIAGPEDLVEAVFTSLAKALEDAGVPYEAGKTLRGGIVEWLEDDANREYFGSIIKQKPYCFMGCFAGKTADDVLAALKDDSDEKSMKSLLKGIRDLAKERGITAMRFSKEKLADWIKETVEQNDIHLVLVWDEFSAFFKNNRTKLDTLQSIASLSGGTRFNMVIVTHFTTSVLPENDPSARIIVDRFKPTVEISMPENIAFALIGNVLKAKPALAEEWDSIAEDLNLRMARSRSCVAKMLKDVKEDVFRAMLPFHPYAALVLKNIAVLFDSNQRSMFTFITADEDAKAFKWFIKNHSPEDGDLLSVDMLWDYFYETGHNRLVTGETGKGNLDAQVRAILDVYPDKSGKLTSKEKRVLKTVLMFQALAKKLNNAPEFLATEENLRLAFEGVDELEGSAGVNVANKLANADGILFVDEINGKRVYQAPMAMGGRDLQEIEKLKEQNRQTAQTKDLLGGWRREDVLRLSYPLEQRFDVRLASPAAFKTVLGQMLAQDANGYRMRALVVIGRNDDDARAAKAAVAGALDDARTANVVFIDATATQLEQDEFDKWADFKARANYYARKDAQQSNNALSEAEKVMSAWRDRIALGDFTVYTKRNPSGAVCHAATEVCEEMRLAVMERYPLALEFSPKIRDTQLNAATKSEVFAGASGGLGHLPPGEKGGKMDAAAEKSLLGQALDVADYWKTAPTLPISKIKAKVEQKIRHAFQSGGEGRIEIGEIVKTLLGEGFMPTALHGYLTGFLLKEYVGGDYRFIQDGESPPLTAQNLTAAILASFKTVAGTFSGRYHEAYIGVLTSEQKRFADLAKAVFRLEENASIDVVAQQVAARIKDFQYPLWCFKSLPEAAQCERYVDQFTTLTNPANQKGATLSGVATDIGRMVADDPGAEARLSALFTKEKAVEAMNLWLDEFEGGAFREVSKEINVADPLSDVRRCFGSNGVWLWDGETGVREIRALLRDYRIVAESVRRGFITPVNSFEECMVSWREKTKTLRIPCVQLMSLRPQSKKFLSLLKDVAAGGRLEHDGWREDFYHELTDNGDVNADTLNACPSLFKSTYSEQLSGLEDNEMDDIYLKGLAMTSFTDGKPAYERMLVQKVHEVKSQQGRARLLDLWRGKTGTDTPHDWSKRTKTPLLAMIPPEGLALMGDLRDALEAANDKTAATARVVSAFEFFNAHPETLDWFDESRADEAFRRYVLGRYSDVLDDLAFVRDRLSRNLGFDPDGWKSDSRLEETLRKLAESEYNQRCAERVQAKIVAMNPDEAKRYLMELVMNSLDVGLSILKGE